MEKPKELDEVKIVIESLYETFVKYLNPDVIINSSHWIECGKDDFLKSETSREAVVDSLIEKILDDDDADNTTASHFTAALKALPFESGVLHPAICGGTDDEKLQLSQCMKDIVSLLDGSLLQRLSLEELSPALLVMMEKNVITKKAYDQLNQIQNPRECSLMLLQSIKKRKPDWPLVIFPVLRQQNPDLMQHQQFHQGEPNESSEIANVILQDADKNNENQVQISTAHISTGFSEFNEVFDTYSEFSNPSTYSHRLIYMAEEQQNSTEMKILIKANNVDADIITSDPSYEKRNRIHASAHSDTEDEELTPDTTVSEETPDLRLREYQKELAENAVKGRNTIICAPTGSGKTRVATYIILNHLQKKAENENRKVAFLARTVPLVMQQFKSLQKYLPKTFEVTSLTGDSEDSMHLHFLLPDNDVIVMTPRILENHLKKRSLKHLGAFSMLVFDECHHTRKGEPYNTLMYSYLKTKKQISEAQEKGETTDIKLPQVVGLTASISVEKAVQDEEAENCILEVCGNLDAETISCVVKNEAELKETVPVPEELLVKLREIEQDEAVTKIIKIMSKLEKSVVHYIEVMQHDELKALVKRIPTNKKSQQYGQWAVKIRNLARAFPRHEHRETFGPVRALIIIADYLSAYNVALELHDLVLLEHVLAYLDKCFSEFSQNKKRSTNEDLYFADFTELKNLMKTRKDTENPNLTRLKETLLKHLIKKGSESRGIIFVRTRALTEALASWLNTCNDSQLQNLKATVFTGTAASVDQGGMTTAEQDEVLQRFRSGDVRLLVSTSVGEEGIDIPECNLVIKYNHVGNEVTTVQTRGRSRKEGGKSILLAMDTIIRKERINQEKAKMMEKAIKKISQMKRSKIRKMNKMHQQQIMKDEEIHQIVKAQEESLLVRKEFKMVCHLCRKVVIDSTDIKTIFKTHHVVVNRNILSQTKTIPFNGPKYIDEIKLIGSVRCMGEPEEGRHCYGKIGSMMVYSKIPFVVIGIKHFGFDSNGPLGLEFYNQWKKVPYAIDEIGPSDFVRYLPERLQRSLTDGCEDNDSDDDSDNDDSPPPSSGETNTSTNKEISSEPVVVDNPSSVTEQKKVPSSQDSNNSGEGNGTNPKRLQNRSEGPKERDSGFSNAEGTTDGSGFPPHHTHSITEVKGVTSHNNLATNEVATSGNVVFSVQPSAVSSFKSNDEYHNTPLMPISQVRRSEIRIEGMKFMANVDKVLAAPSLHSNISEFLPLISSLPLGEPLASTNSDDSEASSTHPSNVRDESDNADLSTSSSNRINGDIPGVSGDSAAPSTNQLSAREGSVGAALSTHQSSAREGSVGAALSTHQSSAGEGSVSAALSTNQSSAREGSVSAALSTNQSSAREGSVSAALSTHQSSAREGSVGAALSTHQSSAREGSVSAALSTHQSSAREGSVSAALSTNQSSAREGSVSAALSTHQSSAREGSVGAALSTHQSSAGEGSVGAALSTHQSSAREGSVGAALSTHQSSAREGSVGAALSTHQSSAREGSVGAALSTHQSSAREGSVGAALSTHQSSAREGSVGAALSTHQSSAREGSVGAALSTHQSSAGEGSVGAALSTHQSSAGEGSVGAALSTHQSSAGEGSVGAALSTHQSSAGEGSGGAALSTHQSSAGEGSVGAALPNMPSNSNAGNMPEVNSDKSDDSEETTVLKVAEGLSGAEVNVQEEQSRQNIGDNGNLQSHTRQPTSGLDLL